MAFNPKYEIDLRAIYDRVFGDRPLGFRRKTRPIITQSSFKRQFATRAIRKIIERTREKRVDKDGNTLGEYSKSYRESEVFKFLKGSMRKTNLTLTGEMLESLTGQKIRSRNSKLDIGLIGAENKAKAHGHITGMEGHPVLDGKVKKRDFLGLPTKVEDEIMKELIKTFEPVSQSQFAQTLLNRLREDRTELIIGSAVQRRINQSLAENIEGDLDGNS